MHAQPDSQPVDAGGPDDLVAALLNSVEAPLVVLDSQGRIVLWNPVCELAASRALDQARHLPLGEVFRLRTPLEAGPLPAAFETDGPTSTGDRRPLTWSNRAISTPDGAVKYQICTAHPGAEPDARKTLDNSEADIAERKRVEEALRQSEERYQILAETAQDSIFIIDRDFKIVYVNQFGAAFLGGRPEQMIGQTMHRRFPPETAIQQATSLQKVLQTGQPLLVESHMTMGGNVIWLSTRLTPLRGSDGTVEGVLGLSRDITGSKRAEEELQKAAIFLHLSPAAIGVSTLAEGRYLEVNEAFERMFGFSRAAVIGRTAADLNFWPLPGERSHIVAQLREHGEIYNHATRLRRQSGEIFPALLSAVTFEIKGVACQIVLISDVAEKKQMEEALQRSEELYRTLAEAAQDSIFMVDPHSHMTYINPFGAALLGKTVGEVIGQSLAQLFPAPAADQQQASVNHVFETGEALGAETFFPFPGRATWMSTRLIPLHAEDGSVRSVFGLARDITAQKETQRALERQAQELARSNADLDKFASVASHDLQEPLRMVASYVQLLQHRYQGRLDADADKMIGFAVDGATRMQRLINDLLAYSRVGTHGEQFAPTDLNTTLEAALANLKLAIEESGAQVLPTRLPTVVADAAQITQLLQNLIGNALKFRRPQTPPEIRIAVEPQSQEWLVYVRDNGIGVDPKYAQRIFEIFQRLHSASEYPGTGIGLAICKKIVERHGGRIWVESTSGQGATFYFTLPRSGRLPG
jgi:PAS domain S-box-containing protein